MPQNKQLIKIQTGNFSLQMFSIPGTDDAGESADLSLNSAKSLGFSEQDGPAV